MCVRMYVCTRVLEYTRKCVCIYVYIHIYIANSSTYIYIQQIAYKYVFA